jgi:hypothetical protein
VIITTFYSENKGAGLGSAKNKNVRTLPCLLYTAQHSG